jgi:hypothetical protein
LAAVFLYEAEKTQRGEGDLEFLKRAFNTFNRLALNFTRARLEWRERPTAADT